MKRSIDQILIDTNTKKIAQQKHDTDQSNSTKGILEQINSKGFIVEHHQDGFLKTGDVPNDVTEYLRATTDAMKDMETNKELDEETTKKINDKRQRLYKKGYHRGPVLNQRATITGYVRTTLVPRLLYYMNMNDKICTTSDINYGVPTKYGFGDPTKNDYLVVHSMMVPMTNQLPIQSCGSFDYLVGCSTDPSITEDVLRQRYTKVHCIDPQHGRKGVSVNGLFQELLDALKKC
jgi:hypothetical protein